MCQLLGRAFLDLSPQPAQKRWAATMRSARPKNLWATNRNLLPTQRVELAESCSRFFTICIFVATKPILPIMPTLPILPILPTLPIKAHNCPSCPSKPIVPTLPTLPIKAHPAHLAHYSPPAHQFLHQRHCNNTKQYVPLWPTNKMKTKYKLSTPITTL